jgi:BON domain-containing protein
VTQRFGSLCLAVLGLGVVPLSSVCATDPLPAPPSPPPAPFAAVREPGRLDVSASRAVAPAASPLTNQQMADAIAAALRQDGQLRRYTIDVTFRNGTADVTGTVTDPLQHDEVLRVVRGVPGVENVRDLVVVGSAGGIVPAQAVMLAQGPAPGPLPQLGQAPAGPQEPTPIFQAGPQTPQAAYNPPPMPPYAWPTYAAYNNYSRVGYPTLYPYQAFPFIGPMYPFPKVPLGWRSVSLTWQDGHWWYGRNATGHDWWRVRYW